MRSSKLQGSEQDQENRVTRKTVQNQENSQQQGAMPMYLFRVSLLLYLNTQPTKYIKSSDPKWIGPPPVAQSSTAPSCD